MSQHSRGQVARNIIGLLITQLGTWSITLVLTLVIPPYLGVQTYGLYAFATTYAGFFALGISLGTGTYLTWRIAREPRQASRLTLNTLLMQIPLGIFWAAVGMLLFTRLDSRPLALSLIAVMMGTTVIASLAATCVAALNGLQIIRTPAFLMVGASAFGTVLILAMVVLHRGVFALVMVGLTTQALSVLIMVIYTHRAMSLRTRVEFRLWPKLIGGGLPFFTWSVVLLFYWQVDIIQLKAMVSDSDTVIGWYSAANRIIGIPGFLPTILVTAILPALSRERTAESPAFRAIASRAIRLVALVNVPACAGTIMLATGVVGLLHYPSTFNQISPLIIILAFNMPLVALDMVLGTVLIALGKQRSWTMVGVIAGIANPLVNLWAIPLTQHLFGDGAIGASLTTIQSELIMFTGAMILRPKVIFTGRDLWYIFRCLLAAGVMIPAVWGLSTQAGIGILPAVGYGVLVYALAAYALQVVRNSDFKELIVAVGARAGITDASQLDWNTLRARLGTNSRVAGTRAALDRVRGAISRPLGSVSRPLARAGSAVSQPLTSASQNVMNLLREQYNTSPVSQYLQKAGEIFSQEEIPESDGDAATEPALEAISNDTASDMLGDTLAAFAPASPSVNGGTHAQSSGQSSALQSHTAAESETNWSSTAASESQRRPAPRPARHPAGRKDPRTMQHGETDPLPSLEEVQRLTASPSVRPSWSAGPLGD